MSTQYQYRRNRLSVLHHVARLGTPTARELATATQLQVTAVHHALIHRWFEVAAPVEHPKRYRLTADGQAAEDSAQKDEVPT